MYNKILLPIDGSRPAYKAVKHALWVAISCNADIIVLNVVESDKLPKMIPVDVGTNLKNMLIEEGNEALDEVSELFDKSPTKINASFIIKEGFPSNTILKIIEDHDIDLVVMGTAGKHRFDRLVMGSVAEKVVRYAKCAVTIIH
jgi:nucleotide-binding universal stress UspA family protein